MELSSLSLLDRPRGQQRSSSLQFSPTASAKVVEPHHRQRIVRVDGGDALILAVPPQSADVWISPLSKGSPTFYVKRKTKELMDQLQFVCTGHHGIDLLALQDLMRTMDVTTDTIPQYIAALEKSQLQAARAEIPILDNYHIMVATKAMLLSERFPWANKDWEDIENLSKSWMKWCKLY